MHPSFGAGVELIGRKACLHFVIFVVVNEEMQNHLHFSDASVSNSSYSK